MKVRQTLTSVAAALLLGSFAFAADNYKIDAAHTRVGFSVRHFGINNVKGNFDEFEGSLLLDEGKIKEASATIQVKSVNTRIQKRDDHLRTADFFDAAKYPTITFKTKSVEQEGGETILIADFTMRGVTKELRLLAKLTGPTKDPWGGTRIGLEASRPWNQLPSGCWKRALWPWVRRLKSKSTPRQSRKLPARAVQKTSREEDAAKPFPSF
jgi:polyisoprenoid-binding protein YceI